MNAARFSVRSEQRSFGGLQGFYEHESAVCGGPMRFAVYQPPDALAGRQVPVLYYLAGLTCTEETFAIKAGAQRVAAELGLMLVSCDTSPRAQRYAGDDARWDVGVGAGFYLDATRAPWSATYKMRSYVTRELRDLVEDGFPVLAGARGIFGHSMGGHGALTLALRYPEEYRSVSAFAPVVAPTRVPWGERAFSEYLGGDRTLWAEYDAVELVSRARFPGTIRVDQGTRDQFLEEQLRPELFQGACDAVGQPLHLELREGYDHSYYFIQTFMEEHLRHHAAELYR